MIPPSASDSSGPASAIASSLRGVGAWMLSGASPPTKPSTIVVDSTPYRRPTSACASSWATTDTRKPTRDRHADEPLDRCREARGGEGRLLCAEQRDDRDQHRPGERDPDLDPEQARDRQAVRRPSGRHLRRHRVGGVGLVRRVRPGPPAGRTTTAASTTRRRRPRPRSCVSTQNACGNSWTSFSVRRVERPRPGREEQLVEQRERLVEQEDAADAADDGHRGDDEPARDRRRQSTAGARPLREHANDPATSSAEPAATQEEALRTRPRRRACAAAPWPRAPGRRRA